MQIDNQTINNIKDKIINGNHNLDDVEVKVDWHASNTKPVYPDYEKYYFSDKKEDRVQAKKWRSVGKVIGLSLLYQSSEDVAGYTVAEDLGVSPQEAQKHTDKWYAGVKTFSASVKNIINDTVKTGVTKTAFKRVRYLPSIDGGVHKGQKYNRKLVNYNKRLAINFPVQSVGADQIKLMNNDVRAYIDKNNMSRFTNHGLFLDYYTRIVSININSSKFQELSKDIDNFPNGNIKVLVTDKNKIVKEYDRNIQLTTKEISKYSLKFLH